MTTLDRQQLWTLLGHPDGPSPALDGMQRGAQQDLGGVFSERVGIVSGGTALPGLLLRPDRPGPHAGVLYCHAHGNRYDIGKAEMLQGRPALQDPPLGLTLARDGYVVLCIDMPGFGDRQPEGTEAALTKAALWIGRSLIGDMLMEQALAFDALCAMAEVDGTRVATVGISMGATLAYMLAALHPGINCTAHLCAFAQMRPLIATGAHDLHGIYMVVPGLLPRYDLADTAALVAPRPQLVCAGMQDPLTPPAAFDPARKALVNAYAAWQAERVLTVITDQTAGHAETSGFRAETLAFLARNLAS